MDQYFKIGKLAAGIGLKGEIILQHSLGKKKSLKGLEAIFLEEKKDIFIPYFIESAKLKSDTEFVIKLNGVDTIEASRKLTPKEVWLGKNDFERFAAKTSPISLLGFTMVSNGKKLGEISEIIEQPHQILCTIVLNGKEALIPMHDDNLEKIDKKNREVFVILPDGLLDIYQ